MKLKLLVFCLITAIPLAFCIDGGQINSQVNFSVEGCEKAKSYGTEGYEVLDGMIRAYVMRNCCSDEIVVEKSDGGYKIIEKDEDGEICKCNCMSTVEIRNVKDGNVRLTFVDFNGEERELTNLKGGFCGWSTHAECSSDDECVVTGCSGQVCAGKGEQIVTTCEWKNCYDAKKFGVVCGCFNGKCQWAQS
ncbi:MULTISPECIES: eight-cysteine-cluster domain-containing protein [unclassified Archaeoglobus]|jgi:eight-cysteine-cluster-containing protein|uniref:eight-cysteine-cluster domain-containing protein n=1 Tax=unclassified Archaeoglobus TaxID=2643606 RepID=UPI0025C1ADCA|nr:MULTISPECIES: eight-cysteine-cluster domain-containing protein [unclassified Archaeoglobus]